MKTVIDRHLANPEFKLTFKRDSYATLLVGVENLAEADTGLTGSTARLYYYKSEKDDSSYQIDSDSLDAATGVFTFNVVPADLAANGAYKAALCILDGSGNVFMEANGSVIIQGSILEAGTTAATAGGTLNYAGFSAFQNVEASGPYRPGTNVTFTLQGDGSVLVNAAGGGGSGDVTAAANITDNRLTKGDGGAKGIQETGISVDDTDNVTIPDTGGLVTPKVQAEGTGDLDLKDYAGNSRITVNTSGAAITGDLTTSGTIDGRDVDADGTKLDGIESGATADQTGAEIKTAYEGEADTNAFTDADHSKLDGIEAGATADQTDAEIATAYGNEVAQVSAGEKTAGTETGLRTFSPKDVADMAGTHGGGGGGSLPAYYKSWEGSRFSANGGPLGAGASPAPHSESGTNLNLQGAAYDDAQTETAGPFRLRVPASVDNTVDVKFHIKGYGGDTNNVVFRVQYATNGDNALTNADSTFAAATSKTAIAENTISVDMTLSEGDELIFYLARLGGDASDTSTGDFVVTNLTVEIARA